MTKQELQDKIRPILEKGKPINDIIFMSKKMSIGDIAFMLWLCRPTKKDCNKTPRFINIIFNKPDNWYGWSAKKLYDFVDNPMWGGDYYQQLLFGCIAALVVYTEDEIVTVLEVQRDYRAAK